MDNNGKVTAYFDGFEYFLSELKDEQADLKQACFDAGQACTERAKIRCV